MNIAALKCSGGLNLGNNFINFGGQSVLEKLYPNDRIEYFEFLDSTLPQWKNKNEILTPSTIDYIKNNFDLIYDQVISVVKQLMGKIVILQQLQY